MKAVAAVEEVAAAAPSPVKRGRRGAAPVQEKEKSPVRRGRKAAVEKIVTEEASAPIVSSPAKKGRKATLKKVLVEETSPLQTASPARKGRKGKTPPAEVETAEAEKKKGGRKAKSAPAIIETIKEVEEAPVVRKGRAASKAATEKIANDVKE